VSAADAAGKTTAFRIGTITAARIAMQTTDPELPYEKV
jgi:hypothetical protein